MPQNEDISTNQRTSADVPASNHAARHGGSGMGVKAIIGFLALFGILLVLGLLPRLKLKPQLESDAAAARTAPPTVTYVIPSEGPPTTKLDLPGSVQGSEETDINARASGYLRQWNVDIGDHVKAGQVLALIETPDTDQQVAQAQAQVTGSQASAQQAQANTIMMGANAEQAEANIAKAQAAYEQSKSDLSHAQAAEAQAQQQADQQRAQVISAQATLSLAKTNADRYNSLVKDGAANQQTADEANSTYETSVANVQAMQSSLKASQANIRAAHESVISAQSNVTSYKDSIRAAQAAYSAAQANVKASRASEGAAQATIASNVANLQRNNILQGFQKVTAPFDGIITSRNAEVGALVSATGSVSAGSNGMTPGSAASSGALFTMVRSKSVRIFVSVPEQFADSVHAGQPVTVAIGEASAQPIVGVVNRNASVLDPTSRTLLAQIDVPNQGGRVRPGMFATVTMVVPQKSGAWRIPDTALVSGAQGDQVAIVTDENTVHFQSVVVGRDYGKEMDITSGLTGNEKLISNPSNALTEGLTVKAIKAKPVAGAPGAPGSAPGGAAPAGNAPASGAPVGGTATGGASAISQTVGGTPAETTPVGAAPVGGGGAPAAGAAPAGNAPAGGAMGGTPTTH